MNKRAKKIWAFLLMLTICISLTSNAAYAEKVTDTNSIPNKLLDNWNGITTMDNFVSPNYMVRFTLTSIWNNGYNANIEIANTGEYVIENWCIEFDLFQDISNIWNAEIIKAENGHYMIKNAKWNQDIPVGKSIYFCFEVQNLFLDFPKSYTLFGVLEETEKEKYEVVYNVVNDWNEGFSGNIVITNLSDDIIEDWSIECEFDNIISTIWNAEITSFENGRYILSNAGYNQNIYPNSSITIGFNC